MIEIPSHVLNDFNAPPAGNFDVMPLHKCKYCSGKGRLRGPAAAARLPPYRHQQQQQPQKYNPNSHQMGKGIQMQNYGSKGGYNRPLVVQQQQIHEYPTKGGSRSNNKNNNNNNNQKIVIVVLHMKNEKLMSKNPYGGTKGPSYNHRDEQQIQQMRYAAPTANNQIYFDAGSFTPMQNGPRIERFDGPASASVPEVMSPASTTTTRRPASSEIMSSINVSSVDREVNNREPVRDVSSDAFHAEEEIITQRKEDDSDGPTTPSPASRPALIPHWSS